MSTNEFEELAEEKSKEKHKREKKKSEEDEKEREEETFDVGGEKKRRKEKKEEKKDATDDDAQTKTKKNETTRCFWTDAVRYESERYLTLVESELKQARMWTRYRSNSEWLEAAA